MKTIRDKDDEMATIDDLMARLWRLSAPASAAMPETFRQGHLEIAGVPFSLRHDEAGDPGNLYVYAAFGKPATGAREAACLRRLLELNLFLFGDGTPTFCLDDGADTVILALRHRTDGLDPARFARTLAEVAAHAVAWREGHFIEDVDAAEPAGSAAAR